LPIACWILPNVGWVTVEKSVSNVFYRNPTQSYPMGFRGEGVYLYDADGRLLLLHRVKNPNAGFYSPIGGKLEASIGEGPHQCAVREIHEESGVVVADEDVRLCGVVTERAYEGETHWLIFLFEVTRPVDPDEVVTYEIDEGKLEWIPTEDVAGLARIDDPVVP